MIYNFYILTTEGIKNGIINTDADFTCAPFGFVPYRVVSTCECDSNVIEKFWSAVDTVLFENNLTSDCFIRAIRAYSDGNLYGEYNGS